MDYFDTSRKCHPLGRLFSNAGLAQLFFDNICCFQFSYNWPVFLEITTDLTKSPKDSQRRDFGECSVQNLSQARCPSYQPTNFVKVLKEKFSIIPEHFNCKF